MVDYIEITFDGSPTEAGQTDTVSLSGSAYDRFSMGIYTFQALSITAVKLYIAEDNTYGLVIDQKANWAAKSNLMITVEAGVVVSTAPAWITFTPASPIFLLPGLYFFCFEVGSSEKWYYHLDDSFVCDLFFAHNSYKDGVEDNSFTLPMKLVAYNSTMGLA